MFEEGSEFLSQKDILTTDTLANIKKKRNDPIDTELPFSIDASYL
jgi:hypothetical protein